jgi:hypothetical protein
MNKEENIYQLTKKGLCICWHAWWCSFSFSFSCLVLRLRNVISLVSNSLIFLPVHNCWIFPVKLHFACLYFSTQECLVSFFPTMCILFKSSLYSEALLFYFCLILATWFPSVFKYIYNNWFQICFLSTKSGFLHRYFCWLFFYPCVCSILFYFFACLIIFCWKLEILDNIKILVSYFSVP